MTILGSATARLRQSHALEHATMHLLALRVPRLRLVGRSDWSGFSLYGNVGTGAVLAAATEALARLRAGETRLAVHPRCGTNLAVGGVLFAAATYVAVSLPVRSPVKRALAVGAAMMGALMLAQPTGLAIQRQLTTSIPLEGTHIGSISRRQQGLWVEHRVSVECEP